MNSSVDQLLGNGPVLPLARQRVSSSTRWSIGAIGLITLLVMIIVGIQIAQDPLRFPVKHILVKGSRGIKLETLVK